MKIVIAGSRSIGLVNRVYRYELTYPYLELYRPLYTEIVSGVCSRGADQAGEAYARYRGIPIKQFPADWDRYHKAAGYRRNAQMAEYADMLIALWDGRSNGTRHMINLMFKLRKPTNIHIIANPTQPEAYLSF